MNGIDTNILVRAFAADDIHQSRRAARLRGAEDVVAIDLAGEGGVGV